MSGSPLSSSCPFATLPTRPVSSLSHLAFLPASLLPTPITFGLKFWLGLDVCVQLGQLACVGPVGLQCVLFYVSLLEFTMCLSFCIRSPHAPSNLSLWAHQRGRQVLFGCSWSYSQCSEAYVSPARAVFCEAQQPEAQTSPIASLSCDLVDLNT